MRYYSEIIPVVSFATLSYMPPPFFGGGRALYARKLMKYVSVHPWFCPHALLLKPLKTGFDCTYSHSGVIHKNLSSEFDFGPYQSGDTFRGTHFELFILPSPNWPIVNIYSFKISCFHGCVMTQDGPAVTPRSRVHRHRHLGGTCCLILSHEDESTKFLRSSIHLQTTRSHIPQNLSINACTYHNVTSLRSKNFEFGTSFYVMMGRDSSVCIATGYGLDGPGIESRWGARFSAPVQTGLGAHPASYTMGTGIFPREKRPGCGLDHTPLSRAEVKERVELYLCSSLGLRGLF